MILFKNDALDNANNYFNHLLAALNKYEGDSLYFASLNKAFIHYLKVLLILSDEAESNVLYLKLTRSPDFKKHPFLIVIIRLLHGTRLTKLVKEATLACLKEYPTYPLNEFLTFSLSLNQKTKILPKAATLLLKEHDPLTSYFLLKRTTHFDNKLDYLKTLAKRGYTFSTLALVNNAIKNNDYHSALALLEYSLNYSNVNRQAFLMTQYIQLAKKLSLNDEFGRKLAQKSIELGNNALLNDLIIYYENSGASDQALLLYYLTIAAHQGSVTAKEKLIAFYKDNEAMSVFLKNID